MVVNKRGIAPTLTELVVELGSQTFRNTVRENKRVLRKQTLKKIFLI